MLAEMSFEPLVADTLETLDVPTEQEVNIFRAEMDTGGQYSDARGGWVVREEDRWKLAAA